MNEDSIWNEAERRFPTDSAYINAVETRREDFIAGAHFAQARLQSRIEKLEGAVYAFHCQTDPFEKGCPACDSEYPDGPHADGCVVPEIVERLAALPVRSQEGVGEA